MTDEERIRLIAAKEAVSARLMGVDIATYHLDDTDPRLEEYCREVATHPERHNLWEQLAVELSLIHI